MSRYPCVRTVSRTVKMLGAGALVVALVASFTPTSALAAPLKLPDGAYQYTVIDQDIVGALQAFGSNLNLKINISTEVSGRIQGKWPEVSPRKFLDWLSGQGNFEWYFDGRVLHISAVKEAQTRLFVLSPITLRQFETALDALGVSDDRYRIQAAPGDALVKVSGPPRFVALAEQTLNGLIAEQRTRPKPDRPKVAKADSESGRSRTRSPSTANGDFGRSRTRFPSMANSDFGRSQLRAPSIPGSDFGRSRLRFPSIPDSDSGRSQTGSGSIADSGFRPADARVHSVPECQDCRGSQSFPPYPHPHPHPHPHEEDGNGDPAEEQEHAGREGEHLQLQWQWQSPGRSWLPHPAYGW